MRHALAFALAASLVAVAPTASALVYDPNNVVYPPNGLLVPIDSSPETQLYTRFPTGRGGRRASGGSGSWV